MKEGHHPTVSFNVEIYGIRNPICNIKNFLRDKSKPFIPVSSIETYMEKFEAKMVYFPLFTNISELAERIKMRMGRTFRDIQFSNNLSKTNPIVLFNQLNYP